MSTSGTAIPRVKWIIFTEDTVKEVREFLEETSYSIVKGHSNNRDEQTRFVLSSYPSNLNLYDGDVLVYIPFQGRVSVMGQGEFYRSFEVT